MINIHECRIAGDIEGWSRMYNFDRKDREI